MRSSRFGYAVVVGLFLLLALPVAGQEKVVDKPELVLVLSGGGARGFAHIGVLRVIEELEIAPDLIVGTSMGSVVGGLYAAGWSPDEIEALVHEIDWETIFTDRLDRQDRSFRRKQDDRPIVIQARLHFEGLKPVLPSGVVEGQRLELLLHLIEALSPATENFDDLPIPFRAVAADIATGGAVVLDSGSLATAIRASMSVPGALPPVEIDGLNLVDGGIAANLPVGIARSLGAGKIIAVDISSPLVDEDEAANKNFMGVLSQLNSLLTAGNVDRDTDLLGPRDVLIVPDLGDISFVSFDRAEDAIAIGEAAARLQIDELRSDAAGPQRWKTFTQRPRANPGEPVEVDRIRLENETLVDDRLVRKALKFDPPENLDHASFIGDLLGLYNTRYFGVIGFKLEEIEPEVKELVIQLPPPQTGRGSLQFGLGVIDDFNGGAGYHLIARHQYLPANRRGGEWETVIQFGTVAEFATEFYQPLDWGMQWFVEPSFSYNRGTQEIWLDGQAFAEYEFQSLDLRVAAGRVLGKWGELRVAAFTGSNRGSPRIGLPEFGSVSEKTGGGKASFSIDTEDSVAFPQHGALVNLVYSRSSEALGAETDFERIWAEATYAWTFGKNTVQPHLEYGENLKSIESFFDAFFLGGLGRLSGLGTNELFGEKLAFARLAAYRNLFSLDMAGATVRFFAGFSLEAGNTYFLDESTSWGSMIKGGSVFVGGETFLGPIIFSYGRADGNRDRFYFAIGDRF